MKSFCAGYNSKHLPNPEVLGRQRIESQTAISKREGRTNRAVPQPTAAVDQGLTNNASLTCKPYLSQDLALPTGKALRDKTSIEVVATVIH